MLQLSPYMGTVATVPRGSCNSHLDVIKLILRHHFSNLFLVYLRPEFIELTY